MAYIMKGKKSKIREVAEALERHHKGKLPKSYYSPDGHLYPGKILHNERPEVAEKKDKRKDQVATEKAQAKLREQARIQKQKQSIVLTKEDLQKAVKDIKDEHNSLHNSRE